MITLGIVNYWTSILVMLLGLYTIIASQNLVKKIIGLSLFQTSVLLFYVAMGKVEGGQPPILSCLSAKDCPTLYANPLPHVLMLTAIVVGVATLAVGLALIVRIKEAYGTVEEQELLAHDQAHGDL